MCMCKDSDLRLHSSVQRSKAGPTEEIFWVCYDYLSPLLSAS